MLYIYLGAVAKAILQAGGSSIAAECKKIGKRLIIICNAELLGTNNDSLFASVSLINRTHLYKLPFSISLQTSQRHWLENRLRSIRLCVRKSVDCGSPPEAN